MNPVIRLIIRDLRATVDKALLTVQLAFPLLLLFVSGFAYSKLIQPFEVQGRLIPYPAFLAAGAIILSIMFGSILAGSLVWVDRRLNMFQQILVGPFTRGQYILSKVISSTLVGLGGAVIISIVALPILRGVHITLTSPFIIIGTVCLSAFLMGSMAIVISTFVTSEQVFNALVNLIVFILMFASSIYYPAQDAPSILRFIFLINPLTYSVDLLRFGLFGMWTSYLPYEALLLATEGGIIFFIAVMRFRNISI
ncbi:MAG: ABC transporter permease [Conexivisphaerales archaeon]